MGETAARPSPTAPARSPATALGGADPRRRRAASPATPTRRPRFDGVDDAASAPVDLSGTHTVTVEFWLKWNAYANDDHLAMEFTDNFNENTGGFLIDPNAPQLGGSFAVGIGDRTLAQQRLLRPGPRAGAVAPLRLRPRHAPRPRRSRSPPTSTAKPVTYTKLDSGTGAGNFANSTLYFMSRAGDCPVRRRRPRRGGDLQPRAQRRRRSPSTTTSFGTNRRPVASFTAPADPVATGRTGHLQRLGLERPRRHDRQIRVGPRRQRQLRDQHRHDADRRHAPTPAEGRVHRRPAGHRQPDRRRHDDAHA